MSMLYVQITFVNTSYAQNLLYHLKKKCVSPSFSMSVDISLSVGSSGFLTVILAN
jgi:hypothetical protein